MSAGHQCHPCQTLFTRANAPSRGRALSLGRNVYLCRQPSGYAMYDRPITTKQTLCVPTSHAGEQGGSSTSFAASPADASRFWVLILSAGTRGKLYGSDQSQAAVNATMRSHKLAVHKAIHDSYMPLTRNPKYHSTDCILTLHMKTEQHLAPLLPVYDSGIQCCRWQRCHCCQW